MKFVLYPFVLACMYVFVFKWNENTHGLLFLCRFPNFSFFQSKQTKCFIV